MQIPGSVVLQQLASSPTQVIRPGQWTVGQLLQATVTRSGISSGLTPQTAVLRIGGQEMLARTPGDLPLGSRLNLKVLRGGQQPVMQITTATDSQAQVAAAATRLALPQQGSLAPLLRNLFTLVGQNQNLGSQLPAGSLTLAKTILAGLPELAGLRDAAAVQRAVANSGIFLEAKLASLAQRPNGHEISPDLKASLLKLSNQIRATTPHITASLPGLPEAKASQPATLNAPRTHSQALPQTNSNANSNILIGLRPGEDPSMLLTRQAQAGLARIQLDQLATVTHDNAKGALWTLEIPIREGDQAFIARLNIQREAPHPDQALTETDAWTVGLEFDLPELGPIHARLSLKGRHLDTRLWAERNETLELMQRFSDSLNHRLSKAGFSDASVAVYPGKPESQDLQSPKPELINLKA